MKDFWDERYRDSAYVYGTAPNVWLEKQLRDLTPGFILFPAEGEGRNAVYAATQGWRVSAFDQSAVAKAKAEQLAAQRQVRIDYQVADAQSAAYPLHKFDAIAFIYAHFGHEHRDSIVQRLLQSLKPGGTVIFEAFSKRQLRFQETECSGGPTDERMLYSIDEVKGIFRRLTFTTLHEAVIDLNEGLYHVGKASVVQFAGHLRSMPRHAESDDERRTDRQ